LGLEQLEARDDNDDDPFVGFGVLQDEFVGQVRIFSFIMIGRLPIGHTVCRTFSKRPLVWGFKSSHCRLSAPGGKENQKL